MNQGSAGDLRIAQTRRAAERSRAAVWSLQHLRICWAVLGAAGIVLAAIGWIVVGVGAAVGALIGTAVVGLFFTISTVIIAKVGARNTKAIMPAALGTYAVKIVILGVVLTVMPRDGFVDTRWMALAVGVGLCAWLGAHMRYVWTAKIFYVDPH